MTPKRDLSTLLKAAERFARAGGDSTLNYFNKPFDLEYKQDQTPVTTADREAEQVIRDAIAREFPDHGIVGEEFGSDDADRDTVWVIDPIDGTRSFIHGVPLYTTLIGVLVEGVPQAGVIYAPALGEMVAAATGLGARLNGRECRVREVSDLNRATFLTTDTRHVRERGFQEPYEKLLAQCGVHRTWGDAYGHMLVATGRADFMFDPELEIWDAAALLPIVTEAGGVFSDVKGEQTIRSRNALSCTRAIHETVLEAFNGSPGR